MSGNVIPSTGVSGGSTLSAILWVKVHKDRLFDLIRQCNLLLSTVRDYSPQFIGTEVGTEADKIERVVEGILVQVSGWEKLDDAAAFLKQNEIQNGIEESHRELTTCTNRFMVALSTMVMTNSESQEREIARQRDHQQPFDIIAVLLEEIRKRGHFITSEAPQLREQFLQSTRRAQAVKVDGQGGVPLVASSPGSETADYSGKVSRISEDVVIEGTQLVFYAGEWTKRTALGRLRDQSPDSQKRFKEWIEALHGVQHRNVLNFFGHVTIDDVVYSVNPWMENGNIREYIERNPDADRVRILSEVASGVEFLHERGIVHGDLCDKNILISRDSKAIVCGFDLFEFSDPALSRARWLAPERITSTGVTSPTEKADIWSFGLLCLEVFTGKDPYSAYSDFYVPILLGQGTHPEHPGSAAVGLSPKMWELMESCWEIDPGQRPSMSRIQSTICDMLPPLDSRHPSTGSMELSVPTLFTPTNYTTPPNEPEPTSVGVLSPLSPLRTPMLIAPPVTQEPNIVVAHAAFLRTVDRPPDALAPIRRVVGDSSSFGSRPLPPLSEDPPNHDIPLRPLFAHSQPTILGGRKQPGPSNASITPNPSTSSLLSRQLSVDSSSSLSTSSTSESRLSPFGHKRAQTTPDTSTSSVNSDTLPPSTPSSPNRPKTAPTNLLFPRRSKTTPTSPPAPNKSKTTPTKKPSRMVLPGPSRSVTRYITLPQSCKWEPITPMVMEFMEKVASDSECILLPARDGTVSAGNLEGLVSRVISDTADSSRNDGFGATFLTIYQLFATSERLLNILKRRFESTELGPFAMRSRYSILLFIESWLKKGFEDEELKCSSMIKEFILALVGSETISETTESKAREIASLIDEPDYVCLRQPKSCSRLRREVAERPQGVMPADLAAALTVVEGDRFRCITYWDYVNFTRQRPNVRRIEVFNIVHDLVTVWVQTTVLRSDSLDERMKTYEEWIYTAEACRRLNNFSSTSAIVIALMSPMIKALTLTCESKAKPMLYALTQDLTPTDGMYQNTLQKLATKDVIPWLDRHLSTLNSSFVHSNLIFEVDGHPLIDFKQCSEIAEQIESLVQYSPPRTGHTTRPDVLAYVEHSLISSGVDDAVRAAEERSVILAAEERSLLESRDKMRRLGFAWLPLRRK